MGKNKGSKKYLIPLFIGIVVAVIGLVMLINGIVMDTPEMGESGWFDAHSQQSVLTSVGSTLLLVGTMMAVILPLTMRLNTPEAKAKAILKMKQQEERVKQILKEHGVDENYEQNKSGQKRYCEYCGVEIPANVSKCESCGSKIKRK